MLGLPAEPMEWKAERVEAGTTIQQPQPLFAKVLVKDAEAALERLRGGKTIVETKGTEVNKDKMDDGAEEKISIDYFHKVKLKVATILSAEPVEGSKKLIKLALDAGEPAPRQIVAGIYPVYQPADLVGKQIVVVANLEPATLRGVQSNGMLLAAWDEKEGQMAVLHPGKPVKPGTTVS
jgi:methionyl-tRNA synthetase